MAIFPPILLTGDYLGPYDRQQQALNSGCVGVVEFHFNSVADPSAMGGEVHYKNSLDGSREFAEMLWASLLSIGLPSHGGQPVKSTVEAPRSAWIIEYSMPAIVLEPLFISNLEQANWLHNNRDTLADAIVAGIKLFFPPNKGPIGLSAGHAGKSAPDSGSSCALGDYEADHTVDLRDRVMSRL